MSPDEAMTLVNYFAAVDRLQNPGDGLHYPYATVPQKEPSYWNEHAVKYSERLQKDSALWTSASPASRPSGKEAWKTRLPIWNSALPTPRPQ